MKRAMQASIPVALCLLACGTLAQAQSILNQSADDLLNGFDATRSPNAPPAINHQAPPANVQHATAANQHAPSILNQSKDDLLNGFDATKSVSAPSLGGPQSSGDSRSWAPNSASGGNAPGSYAPGSYQFPATPQKGLIQRLIETAMTAVNVSNEDGNGTHIKAPFVNVNVGGSNPGVKVKAPFVNYDTINGPNVKAPFVKYNSNDGASVKAPFVNINGAGSRSGSSKNYDPGAYQNNPSADPNQGSSLR